MKIIKIPNALVGICGVYYVGFELSRRGLIALPTIRNTAGYDIIVASRSGKKHTNIQVKASQKSAKFWPMPSSKKVRDGPDDFYVLVRGLGGESGIECFIVEGAEAKAEVKKCEVRQTKRGRRVFQVIHVEGNEKWRKLGKRWKKM